MRECDDLSTYDSWTRLTLRLCVPCPNPFWMFPLPVYAVLIRFDNFAAPVLVENGTLLIPVLRQVFGTWRFAEVATSESPQISVRHIGSRYLIDSPWLEETARDATEVGAACCLSIDLTRSFVDADPTLLCLHAAAVEIDGRLVVFPSTSRSGKSTLCARLAAEGFRIFADDMLPIDASGRGRSFGVALRLRIPLPDREPMLQAFVDAHAGPRNQRYLYLSLPDALLAPHGAAAPIGAFVFLERRPGPGELTPIARDRSLAGLLQQNILESRSAADNLDRLGPLIRTLSSFTLSYSNLDEALQLLRDGVSAERPVEAAAEFSDVRHVSEATSNNRDGVRPKGRRGAAYVQVAGVTLRDVGGALFLARANDTATYHLNSVAAGLWRLLAEPITAAEAADVLRTAFPDANAETIMRDTRRTFGELQRAALIRKLDAE